MAPHRPLKQSSETTMSDHAPASVPTSHSNGEPFSSKAPPSQIIEPTPGSVNRKKQKRRQKQAARQVLGQRAHNGCMCPHHAANHPTLDIDDTHSHGDRDYDSTEVYYNGNGSVDAPHGLQTPSAVAGEHEHHSVTTRKTKKKKSRKRRANCQTLPDGSITSVSTRSTSITRPLPSHTAPRTILKATKNRSIWNTSTHEERENIKAFWLELGEEDRRQLVKVEKDAVLKKMKEQQKHSCSCTVCGRKRTAIEEELEVLYDAYYEELEQYANTNQDSFDPNAPIVPPPRLYQPPLCTSSQHTETRSQFHSMRGQVQELPEDDDGLEEDEGEEDEEDDDDDDSYSDEEFADEDAHAPRADLFAFGNSLTVKDGILTVADDLLKNDGKHFIDMMEQLAERRMQREVDTQYGISTAHQSFHDGHSHVPLDEDDYDDEEDDDEEYESQEEDDYEEDEMDAMTEEQRMEEGRRMFQIFAARMFEQRVLTAYREKVAEQRQQKLIEELLEEETRNEQRSAKKAREAQKKKDKKRLQRQAKEEEKARRDAERTAAEVAAKAEQEKKLEEQKKKREEQRKKREAERRAQEEERARKEAEKQRRLREEKERQADAERKQREQKEQQEREKRERARQKKLEGQEKRLKEGQDRRAHEEQTRKESEENSTETRRRAQGKLVAISGSAPVSSSLQNSQSALAALTSPHQQAATPVVPKASTPAKRHQPSRQNSHSMSPVSQPTSGEQLSVSPRSMPLSQSSTTSSATSKQGYGQQPPILHHPQPSASPLSPLESNKSHLPGSVGLGGLPTHPPGMPGMVPRPSIAHELPVYHSQPMPPAGQLRNLPTSGIPPGFNGTRITPQSRTFPFESGPAFQPHGQQPLPSAFSSPPAVIAQTHIRQLSSSVERPQFDVYAQPHVISRPKLISRSSSTVPQDQHKYASYQSAQRDIDNLSMQLGSSALLDDVEPSCPSSLSQSLPGATASSSLPPPNRASFSVSSMLTNPVGVPKHVSSPVGPGMRSSSPWGIQPFGGFPGAPTWEVPPGSGWSNITLGSGHYGRAYPFHVSRPAEVRMCVIQACSQLGNGTRDFHDMELVARRANDFRSLWEPAITMKEVQEICDTEGNPQNGGGSFTIVGKDSRKYVKFEPGNNTTSPYSNTVPGEIGSPIPSGSSTIGSGPFHRQFTSPPAGF